MNITREKIREMEQKKLKNPTKIEKRIIDEFMKMGLDYKYTGTHHLHDAVFGR